MTLRGKTLWMVFHTFENGHQHEVYEDQAEALEHAADIIMDYVGSDDYGDYADIVDAYHAKNYALVVERAIVPDIDDHCNVEVMQITVQ